MADAPPLKGSNVIFSHLGSGKGQTAQEGILQAPLGDIVPWDHIWWWWKGICYPCMLSVPDMLIAKLLDAAIVLQSRWPCHGLGLCVTGSWKLEMVGSLRWSSALAGLWIKSIETGSVNRLTSHTGVGLAAEQEERPWPWQVSGGPPLQTARLGESPSTLLPSVTLPVSTCLAHAGVCTSLSVTCSQLSTPSQSMSLQPPVHACVWAVVLFKESGLLPYCGCKLTVIKHPSQQGGEMWVIPPRSSQ